MIVAVLANGRAPRPRAAQARAARWLVAAIAALPLALLFSADRARAAGLPRPNAVVRIERAGSGTSIPSGFVGLAMEYRAVPAYAGVNPKVVNPVLVQLIRNVIVAQTPLLRIGGDSTDWTWWPIQGTRRLGGLTYALSPGWLASARALAQATRARLILGINLEAGSSRIAAAEAHALISGIGRRHIAALEIGNEPELYPALPWYHTSGGLGVLGRSASYGPQAYTGELSSFRSSLPAIPLAEPATGDGYWLSNLAPFLVTRPGLTEMTFHRYALNNCANSPGTSSYPTVRNLLAPAASRGLMDGVEPAIATAHQHGIAFRVDELNSVTCGGLWGVSNTFASALWVLDALFAIAEAGVDGVNIETSPFPGTPNQLFTFRYREGRWVGSVRPEYYGLLMFAQAAPPGARLLRIAPPGGAPVRSWATLGRDRRTRVVLINDSFKHTRSVRVRVPRSSGRATLELLRAPSAYATAKVTFGGQSFGPETATGTLDGPRPSASLPPSAGAYHVSLPPASAALLTVPGAQRLP